MSGGVGCWVRADCHCGVRGSMEGRMVILLDRTEPLGLQCPHRMSLAMRALRRQAAREVVGATQAKVFAERGGGAARVEAGGAARPEPAAELRGCRDSRLARANRTVPYGSSQVLDPVERLGGGSREMALSSAVQAMLTARRRWPRGGKYPGTWQSPRQRSLERLARASPVVPG